MQHNVVPVSGLPVVGKTVIIDPGHGGIDGGAVGFEGVVEKDINLEIALKLKTMLSACGFDVILTRETDCMIGEDQHPNASIHDKKVADIRARVDLINSRPDAVVLSIHQNLFSDGRYHGAQMFYRKTDEEAKVLATFLQQRFATLLQPDNQRAIKPAGENIYLMNHVTTPTVLVECGFVSNALEAKNLTDDEYQNKICFTIFAALTDYFEKDVLPTQR